MKKSILTILFIILLHIFYINNVAAGNNEVRFIVTAYYSPLPNQKQYSYSVYTKRQRTYEEEKRLQWEWIRWASWKKVFPWMLAAPKNYKFWTKIYLEWLGVWEVADRWWAIVNKWVRWHSYDRIDVWMWYWDDWLRRASYWWKREVKWNFLNNKSIIDLDYTKIPLVNFKYKNKVKKIFNKEIDVFSKKLTKNNEYKRLQEIFKELWLYNWLIDWDNTKIIDIIYDFQLSEWIVKSIYSAWAWNYWPKTRKALKNKYNDYIIRKNEEKKRLALIVKQKKEERLKEEEKRAEYKKIEKLSFNMAINKVESIWSPKFWEISYEVRELQKTLNKLWYFTYKDTAIYWNITKNSIISYQIDRKIINEKNELWAWIIWPKTKKALKDDLKKFFFNDIISKNKNELITFNFNEI